MTSVVRLWRLLRPPTWRHAAGAAAVLGLIAIMVGGLAQARVQTSVSSFLPSDDPAVADLERVGNAFGGDAVVVLLESEKDNGLLAQPQLSKVLKLEGELAGIQDVASVSGPVTSLNQIAGRAQDFMAELTGRRTGVRAQAVSEAKKAGADSVAALAAGDRAVAKFDQRYGRLMLEAMPSGMPTLSNEKFVDSVVYDRQGAPKPQWRFVVPSPDAIAILVRPRQDADAAAIAALVERTRATVVDAGLDTSRITVSGVPAVASALGSQVTAEIPLIGGLAVIGVGACLLVVPWTRWRRRLLPLATTLGAVGLTVSLFGWAGRPLSLGVMAFLSVLLGVGSYYATYLAHRVRTRTVLVVSGGTAASFATLLLSPLPYVRDLGLTLAVGVLLSTAIGWVIMRSPVARGGLEATPVAAQESSSNGQLRSRGARWAGGVVAAGIALGGWAMLPGIGVQTDVDRLAHGLPALSEADHASQVMRSTGEVRVAVRGPDVLTPAAYRWMRDAQQRLIAEHGDELRPALSLPTMMSFLGADPSAEQIRAAARLLPPYLVSSALRDDRGMAVLSFGINTNDIGEIRTVRDHITSTLPSPPLGYHAEVTGIPIVGVRANELVSQGRIWVNLAGILAASVVLALGLRRRTDALRAMAAAVLATGAGFLLLWAGGMELNPITVALGSLTSAVACEFTVLLATAVRRGNPALRRAVLLAAVASATGYVVLAASRIALIREFGVLLGATVLLALAASSCVVALTVRPRLSDGPKSTTEQETTHHALAGATP